MATKTLSLLLAFLNIITFNLSYAMDDKERINFNNAYIYYAIVSGQVIEDGTNLPVANALIEVKTSQKNVKTGKIIYVGQTSTDTSGYFSLAISGRHFFKKILWGFYIFVDEFEDSIDVFFTQDSFETKNLNIKVKFKKITAPSSEKLVYTPEEFALWEEKHIFQEKLSEIPHTRIPPVYLKRIKK